MRIAGAVALVTGASSGVGRATACALAGRGATLLLHGRDRTALSEVADRTGGSVLIQELAEPGAARRLADQVSAAGTGVVDILVANAGAGFAGEFSTMDEDAPERMIAANLTAPVELTRLVLPGMLERGRGSIVFVTSIAGRAGVAGEAVYAATKAGLDIFAESLRLELRGTGVDVGVLVPGVVATRFFDRRGRPYGRAKPRPLPAEAAAAALVRIIETGRAETYLPGWLRLPVAVRSIAPGLYRRLAGRFGGS
ncbi:MAG TPA: SDR family NAD(P)-dependent oxidoreductase [Micromonosporaceae bacterium]